jgi:serine/threonine protein kinase/tetratricopeptide (TPR) repeat protein
MSTSADSLGPKEHELFTQALECPSPEQRAAFLDQACAGDTALRARLETLLQRFDKLDTFLEKPAVAPEHRPTRSRSGSGTESLAEKPGDRIGRYKLIEKLGEGGCGVVYMAEQEEPVRRQVALKIIKLGMDTQSVIARFEAERQALALMDHPNIAKVFDAGATEAPLPGSAGFQPAVSPISNRQTSDKPQPQENADALQAGGSPVAQNAGQPYPLSAGRPYFVMELVRGPKITDYCDQQNLSTSQRLDLFVQVCQAIQHAHQKGVIHRDIKPSNVLVTITDGKPVPKVIDFGIAKATTGQPLTDRTVHTALEQFIGTPAYMSPEQAELSSVDIDTRSDIYSLGVLLYELLTGKPPFDSKELLEAGFDAMRRTIREQEPPTPSARLRQTSGASRSTPPAINYQLSTDLDWIVMKCLEKDRSRRYETANGLARDIQRHLNNEPVVARPASALYRLQKTIRRNKLLFAATGAVFLSLVLGLGLSTWLFLRERASRREQERLRLKAQEAQASEAAAGAKAQTEAAKSQQVAQFLRDTLTGVGPSKAAGRDATMLKEILDRTAERVGKDLTNQPEVEIELRITLAATYDELGLFGPMQEMAQRSLALARARFGETNAVTAYALQQLGEAQFQLGNYEDAENTFRQVVKLRRDLLGTEHRDLALSEDALADALRFRGKLAEAEELHREALAILRKALGNGHKDVGGALANLTDLLREEGKLAEADSTGREAVTLLRKSGHQLELAGALYNLAIVVKAEGHESEAEAMDREALDIRRKLLDPQHPSIAESLNALSIHLAERGDGAGAESAAREALAIRRKALGSEHALVAHTLYVLGGALKLQDKLVEAEEAFREAVALGRKALGNEDQHVAWFLSDVAQVLKRQGKLAEAEQAQREAVAIARKAGSEHPYTAQALNSLAVILAEQAKFAEAESAAREAVAIFEKVHGTDHPNLAYALSTLSWTLQNQMKLAEAETLAVRALEMRRKLLGNEHPQLAVSLNRLAGILTDEGKLPEGEALYREALEVARKRGPEGSAVRVYLTGLAVNLRYQGRPAEAETLARQALALDQKALGQAHPGVLPGVNALAAVLQDQAKLAEADQLYRDQLPAIVSQLGEDSLALASALAQWAEILVAQGRGTEAEPLARQCLEIFEHKVPSDFVTASARTTLGAALLDQKRYSESEPLLLSGYREIFDNPAQTRPAGRLRLERTVQSLVQLYLATSRPDQAAEWKQKLQEFEQVRPSLGPQPAKPPP